MHQPTRTAGPRLSSFGWALTLSVCAHGLLLSAWLYARYLAQQGPIGIGQKRGGLTVQLTLLKPASTASVKPAPTPTRPDALPQPKRAAMVTPQPSHDSKPPSQNPSHQPDAERAPSLPAQLAQAEEAAPPQPSLPPSPEPAAATAPASSPSPQAAPQATQAANAEQAGARFANMFAPIISRPLGRGRWSAQPMRMQPEAQAAMQREQAIQGLRQAVQVRTDMLRTSLQAQPLSGVCEIRLALERQTAHIHCDNDQDQGRIAASLSGIVTLLPQPSSNPTDNCLRISGADTRWRDCP